MAAPEQNSANPGDQRSDALAIVKRLRDNGHSAYFAGGCVRDSLLGIEPADFDVATDALPDRVRALFPFTQAVGAAFGVILVRQGRSMIEVATFRSDGRYTNGRRPESVTFSDAAQDARRRDFTINGLFFDPMEDRLIDFVGGEADLRARVLRAVGDPDERFGEDHLRVLRAVRFASRFDLSIDPATLAAVRKHAPSLKLISPERVCDELRRMLTPVTRNRAYELLKNCELLPVIVRFLPERVAAATQQVFPRLEPGNEIAFGVALAAIAVDWLGIDKVDGRAVVRGFRKALRYSNDEADLLEACIADAQRLVGGHNWRVSAYKRFLAKPTAVATRQLLAALAGAGMHAERIASHEQRFIELSASQVAPQPLLTGDDLVALGWKPGPTFKWVLDEVYDAQLEDQLATKEDALRMARSIDPRSPKS